MRDAFALLPSLLERGFPIDRQTVNILLSGCARTGDLVTALRLWDAYFAPYARAFHLPRAGLSQPALP